MAYMYNALDDLGFTQIVVPPQLRTKLLYVAFYIPVIGHLGENNLWDRLLSLRVFI